MTRQFLNTAVVCLGALTAAAIPKAASAQTTVTFANSTPIAIPGAGTGTTTGAPASVYPSNITVSGLTAPIAKVTVTLAGFSHTFPDDVDVLLVAPDGAKLVLLSDAGFDIDATSLLMTFSDASAIFAPDNGPLTVANYRPSNYATVADPFPAPAPTVVSGDSPAPGGTATFASKFAGHAGNGTWSLYVVDDLAGDSGTIAGGWSLTITTAGPATAGQLLISEFRLRGPLGNRDEFIEIYNATNEVHVVQSLSGTGYGIAASDGVTRCSIPNGTVIPARGHFLCVNSAFYSLGSYPAASLTTAIGDATFTTDIPDNAGIAIFNNNTGGGSYSLANRIDAVGSTSEANTLYKEGNGYLALTAFSIEASWTRRPAGGCTGAGGNCTSLVVAQLTVPVANTLLADTNNNVADFIFVDTNGTFAGPGQRLGAPGPENMSSPLIRDGTFTVTSSKLDSCAPLQSQPNIVRDFTPDPPTSSSFGTLDIRRTFTNKTGAPITRLRFRIVDITTFPAPTGVADLRPRNSSLISVGVDRPPCGTGMSSTLVVGTTLETPPSQPNGGGYNSSLSVGDVSTASPLANNTSMNVRFLLGVQQAGFARFCVVPEVLPDAVGEPFCYIGNGDGGDTYAPGDFDNDGIAEAPLYNRTTGVWTLLRSDLAFTGSSTVNFGGAGFRPVPGDYDGDNRLDPALYQKSTGLWTVQLSTSAFTRTLSVNWGGSGYEAVPGDYDGDGVNDLAVYYPLTGYWYVLTSATGYTSSLAISWGGPAYTPVGGLDFDGDRRADLTIYNESIGTWYVLLSGTGYTTVLSKSWGGVGYTLVPGDYDGDGKADFGVYNRTTGFWYVLKSDAGYTTTLAVSWGGPGYVPMPADYDGDGRIDLGLYQLQTTTFMALKSSSAYGASIVKTFGTANDVPMSAAVLPRSSREIDEGDFDGDFTSDITVYNTTSGVWSILKSSTAFTTAANIGWGGTGYTAVPGDYDGDGLFDLGLYQGATGNWLVLLSASGYSTTLSKSAGGPGYVPVPGDYDGDGKVDLVVYNTTTGVWYGLKSSTGYTTTINVGWGGTGYTAVPGDYDGDGKQDLGLYQGSTGNWLILTSSSSYLSSITRTFGGSGYVPVAADHDGDGITDFAVYRTSTGVWSLLKSSSGNTITTTVSYGGPGYTPVAGDWDGDGCADVGVYDAAGNWSILLSSSNYTTSIGKSWGGAGYAPLPIFP